MIKPTIIDVPCRTHVWFTQCYMNTYTTNKMVGQFKRMYFSNVKDFVLNALFVLFK